MEAAKSFTSRFVGTDREAILHQLFHCAAVSVWVQSCKTIFMRRIRKRQKVNRKYTQLMALQAQINPHFLYNCLSAILDCYILLILFVQKTCRIIVQIHMNPPRRKTARLYLPDVLLPASVL
ncbi:MAG: histidine kinase [Lachnospiraceae bacterium]|nr:histidine kinase [Lachnospiraceae bacterium]